MGKKIINDEKILELYNQGMLHREIAKELGVSQVQISRIENKVLIDMKERLTI